MFRFIRLLLLLAIASLIASCGGKSAPATWDPSAGTPADTVAPSQPGGLVAAPMGTTGASLSWSPSTDNVTVVSYVVSRNGTQVATSATTRYVDSGLAPATTYSYRVAAVDEAGNMSPSSPTANVTTAAVADTTPPSQPTGLAATAAGAVAANLSWNASIDNIGVTGYIVSRNGVQVATPAATSFADTALAPATTYTYTVVAQDAAGNQSSPASASVTTGTPADTTPPSQPAGLTGTPAGGTGANLSWSASADDVGVTGYIVTRNGIQIATPIATSFADSGLTPATTYSYTVAARDAAGNRSTTASVSVTTIDTLAPSTPTGLTGAASGSTGANLSWNASTDNVGVTGYIVTRNGVQVGTPTATSFADTGLTAGTTYSYTVVATDAAGNRSTAASVSVTIADTLAPSTPTGLTGVASGSTGANLSWNASTDNVGVTGYIVTRNGVQVATPTATSFADTGLVPATIYTYTVVARDAAGNRSTAASVSVTIADTLAPSTPTGLTGVASGSTGANLSWNASTDNVGVTGYIVTRNGVQVATPTATSFADTGLAPATTYTYAVVARDAAGNQSSPASASVTTGTPADTTPPSQPAGLTGTPAGGTGANLSWSASTDNVGVTGYIVSRNGVQIATPAATSFADTGLIAGTTYSYTVVATDAAGNRSTTASVSVTTIDTLAPSTPTGLTGAASGSTGANLSWNASTDNIGVTGYIVSRNGVQVATPTTTSFTDTGLTAATTYSYTVVATDAVGNRSTAASASVTTGTPADTTPPSQPAGLTGTPAGGTGANLSWSASADDVGVTGYIVTRNGIQIATPIATSFADSGLTPATTYSYTVAARDAAGNRSTTASVSVTTIDTLAPSTPTGLTGAASGSTGANLSWNASTDNVGVTGYIVTRNGVQVGTPTATSFADTGLTAGTTYSYTVVATDAAGNRSTAASVSVTIADTLAPSTPTGLTGVASGSTGANLSWNASTDNVGVTGYIVTRNGVQVATPTATSFADTGLTAGTTYSYTVVATDAAGNRSTAASVSVTIADTLAPSTPTGLTGVASGSTGANLSWNASTDNVGVTGYIVSRNGVQIATPAATSFADTGLVPATIYTYTVVAQDAAGNRSAASSVSITIPDTVAPSQPGAFTVIATSSVQVNLSWAASTDNVGVTGYIVSRNGVQIATPTATSFADTGLTAGTTYSYTVVARDAAGNLSTGASAATTTPADTTPPSQPTGLAGTPAGGTGANLSWKASTDNVGVTGYIVSRNGVQVGTPTATSFADTGLTAGTTYSYTVVARDAAGNRSTPASVSVTIPDTVAPSQPGAFTAIATSSVQVSLSWAASTDNVGVTGYIVTRNGVQIATPTARTLVDSGLTPSTTYTYTVVARDAAGNRSTAASASATTPATPITSGTVNLGWDAVTVPNLLSYRVYYGTASGTYLQPLGQGLISVPNTFTVVGLAGGTRYFFAVTATDSLGNESGFSNEVFADVP